ncbi:hypothetical protein SAMN03159382_01008 [Pseudomonas sp. NFACC23-1]|uniref:hypothetical protein n=1 Tax=unclassified Pseudomonas TaxID=196821 RepID=UPI00088F80E6|nr:MULTISPECIES: hypothetical protein [unclassified Pseudomonas]SDB43092.1 hypothetical protein SAMN03159386_03151 [Pseudomonas sp. NFACC17-2]SEJ06757.1 hypothetical protein SAMN03159382_01008 [Pseudomonas sp. NFACC23-1]SFW41747.1 hypothetical protein SAMN05660640_01290 [Pseudomonas sp. NFACC16-2]
MSEAWNLEALRAQVKIRQPETSKRLVQIINSLGRSRDIFTYHKCLARDAFTAFNAENDPHGIKFAQRILGCDDEDGAVHEAGLVSEANLIACIAITRNSYDSFGQLLNGLVVPVPLKRNFYIQDVEAALPTGELKDRLSGALTSEWFGYTHAFMNMVKHHQLIVHNPSISFIDENRGGKVEGFRHREKDYPACWVREALEGTVELQNLLRACGVLLNRMYLGENPAKPTGISSTNE